MVDILILGLKARKLLYSKHSLISNYSDIFINLNFLLAPKLTAFKQLFPIEN